jgi:hypothetical protein
MTYIDLERITVGSVPEFTGANVESAQAYFRAKFTLVPLLKHRVIDPFETLLKKQSGYDNNNLPAGKEVASIECGELEFSVTSERRVKRPGLLEVYTGIINHLDFLKEGYDQSIQRKGVRTSEDKPYVVLDDLLDKISALQAGVTTNEVKQSLSKPDHNYGGEALVISLTQPLGLVESDATLYLNTTSLQKQLKDGCVKPFDNYLKAQTGYGNGSVPAETVSKFVQIKRDLFEVQSIPEQTVKYKDIVNGLVKNMPKRITAKSKIGELVMIKNGLSFDVDVGRLYDAKTIGGDQCVSIDGTSARVKQLKEKHTNPSVNQKIFYYPAI